MADGSIDLNPGSGGAAMDEEAVTYGSQTRYRSRVVIGGDTQANVVYPTNTTPSTDAYGLPVRQVDGLPSGTNVVGYTGDEWYFWLANGRNHLGSVRVDSGLNSTASAHMLVEPGSVSNPNGRSAVVTRIDISCSQTGRIRMAVGSGSWPNGTAGAKANKRTDTAASDVVSLNGDDSGPSGSPVYSGEYQVQAGQLFTLDLADSPILLVPGTGLLGLVTSGMSTGVILAVTFHWTELAA